MVVTVVFSQFSVSKSKHQWESVHQRCLELVVSVNLPTFQDPETIVGCHIPQGLEILRDPQRSGKMSWCHWRVVATEDIVEALLIHERMSVPRLNRNRPLLHKETVHTVVHILCLTPKTSEFQLVVDPEFLNVQGWDVTLSSPTPCPPIPSHVNRHRSRSSSEIFSVDRCSPEPWVMESLARHPGNTMKAA